MAAFALALGVAAHMLDELNGRPLQTQIPVARSWSRSPRPRSRAPARSGSGRRSSWGYGLLAFVAVGAFVVPAYNLEWFGGRIHNAWGLALAWGGAPGPDRVLRRGADPPRADAILAAAFATALILVQRALSTPVREARRQRGTLEGVEPMERALRILPWANVLLAAALVSARLT